MRRPDSFTGTSSLIQRVINIAAYAVRQKIVLPIRWALWRRHRRPFEFVADRGIRFRLYPPEYVDGSIFANGIFERHLLQLLQRNLRGGVMLDVGANIGNHALYLAGTFDRVICFEPNPIVLDRLRDNIELNRAENVTVYPVGLGELDAELPFYDNTAGNIGGGSFVRSEFPANQILPIRNGDRILRGVDEIALIKIDVEGFEASVLSGLSDTIARNRPLVVLEFDGRASATSPWTAIASSLPGYLFAELLGIPGRGLDQLKNALRDGVDITLRAFRQPEGRYYENILAFPSREAAADFGVTGL